jgi:two-component system, OmpR family, sensor histidine kinase KdpD
MPRGKFRVYLGAAPGVGKTFDMLDEGWRRKCRGTDVVIGLVVTHDRARTIAQIRDLEVIPPRSITYRDTLWEEMDVDAILSRRPEVVLVDELAHSNVPGCRNEKRWQDIEELLAAGIEVISTVNIQHLESVNDVVNEITGVIQRETVPDIVVRHADQIELVDMSPEALRRRMAHGNIYPAEKVDAALGNYFRVGNLAALRELALLWVADRVEDSLQEYMANHGITGSWETRERVLVAITGAPGGDNLIRRSARMARRVQGDLLGVHVVTDDGLRRAPSQLLDRHRAVLEEIGGSYHEATGGDVSSALVEFATAHHATQLVLGTSRRSRWAEWTRGSVINDVIRRSDGIDVHVISTDEDGATVRASARRLPIGSSHGWRRILLGFAFAAVALGVLIPFIAHNSALRPNHPGPINSAAGFLVYLGVVIVVATIGGAIPAFVSAFVAAGAVDWYLMPPYGSFAIARGADTAYLAAFLVSSGVVSVVVELGARRRVEVIRSRDEADAVRALADRLAAPDRPQAVLEEIKAVLARQSVTLLSPQGDGWSVDAASDDGKAAVPVARPEDGEPFGLRNGKVLVLRGPPLRAADHRLVAALVSYLEAVMATDLLQSQAAIAERLSEANDLRTALLEAVSHDLRTPLASIRALTTGWLAPDVNFSEALTRESMAAIDLEAQRLNNLVDNLLDMSRLQTGALSMTRRPVGLDEVVPAALASLSQDCGEVIVDVPETLPRVNVDAVLLERAIANLVDNAVHHSPPGRLVRVEAGAIANRVDLRVVDRGPGVPLAQRELMFQPFQRLGDSGSGAGVGLGLAVARGFVELVGGEIAVEDTPGGGLTMVLSLPAADEEPGPPPESSLETDDAGEPVSARGPS